MNHFYNLVHLKRAVTKIGSDFNRIEFDSDQNIRIDDEPRNDFEYYPDQYDYSERNEIIERAFFMYLTKSFETKKTFTAFSTGTQIKIIVKHDDETTFIGTASTEINPVRNNDR